MGRYTTRECPPV